VNVNDVFRSRRLIITTNIGGNQNDFNQYFREQTLSVTLRYKFSRGATVNEQRRNTPEELRRAGGGG